MPIPSPRFGIEPLTAKERRMFITVTPEFLSMLDACKDALSHVMPGADATAVFEEGMKLILAKDAKKKALVAKPRPRKDPQLPYFDSRSLPAELRREVWKRDQGRCQWRWRAGRSAARPTGPSSITSTATSPASPSRRRT